MFLSWLRGQRGEDRREGEKFGDGLYGKSIEILREAKRRGWEIYVKVREGIWQGVRAKERKEAMREWEEGREIYRQRYKIEQVIGLLKRSYGEGCRERSEEMAKKAIMMRAVLWNMAVLTVSGFFVV
jgi:hypothetical protein